jgi:DUF4097 and DUF4098 domain-containing protein YvlB
MIEEHFTTPNSVQLEVKLPVADVEVTTVDGLQSTVTVDGPDKLLDAIRVELSGDRLRIDQPRRSFKYWFGRFDSTMRVRVSVPHHTSVEIVNASGEARLDGTFADVSIQSASGDIRIHGEIEGDAALKTVSGDVRAARIDGSLTVNSVSGDLHVEAVEGSLTAKSVSGDISVGSLRSGRVSIHCVSGDVELGIAAGSNLDVDAQSAAGQLVSELPLSDAPSGDAGPTVVIRGSTVSGDFRVVRAREHPHSSPTTAAA